MDRRKFFQSALITVAGLTGARKVLANECKVGAAPAGQKVAADKERLDYESVAANAKGNAKYVEGSTCANCKFYKKEKEQNGFAPCPMMANKFVSNCGWCKSYAKKA